jgi:hypothetical protein
LSSRALIDDGREMLPGDAEKVLTEKGYTHEFGHSNDTHSKYQFFMRLSAEYNQIATIHNEKIGYGALEDFIKSFVEANVGSMGDFETEIIGGVEHFKRAFLMSAQFINVLNKSKIRFYAVDAGKKKSYFILQSILIYSLLLYLFMYINSQDMLKKTNIQAIW